MEKFKRMSHEELVALLRSYGISHGPIVDTTRTLYEKKLLEFERKKTGSAGSTYESKQQYSRKDYDNDNDNYDTYEEETYTKTYSYPQAQQMVREDLRSRGESNTYQNISQVRHQSTYSQGVEPRRPIRPKAKEEEAPSQPSKRFLPLWLQILLLLIFAGYLAYLYFRDTKENPFKFLEENLFPSGESAASTD
ncbi:emerin [Hyperolius riggenbachi]|uniref:emerin n=1 Tax=Hyperolius riggenbachi TaxID=752182 RepID=UPI0035A3557C